MTELSFLLDLLLNHKLPKATRETITARVKDVEIGLSSRQAVHVPQSAAPFVPSGPPQAASTLAAMARHAEQGLVPSPAVVAAAAVVNHAPPVAVVAQTPAAMAAMNARQETLNMALSGKPAKGETRPRKF